MFLNKSATVEPRDPLSEQSNDASYRWLNVPRWYLWDGGFLLIGQAQGVVPAHSHHAIQIVISLDQPSPFAADDENWHRGAAESLCGRTPCIPLIAMGLLERCFLSIRSRAKARGCDPAHAGHHDRARRPPCLVVVGTSHVCRTAIRQHGNRRAHPPLCASRLSPGLAADAPPGPARHDGAEADSGVRRPAVSR